MLVKVKVILQLTVSRPVRLGVRHPSGTRDLFFPSFFCIDNSGFLDVCVLHPVPPKQFTAYQATRLHMIL
jgi:hypothetical protein